MEYGTVEEEHSPSQSQKTLAAHVDSRLFRGMANGGDMRAHHSEAFKKFKAGAKRILVSQEVLSLLQGASATLRDSQAEYQRGKLLPSQSQKGVSSDAHLQQQQLGAVAEANDSAGGAPDPARSTPSSRPGSAIQRSQNSKTKVQKSAREDWGYFEHLGALRAASSPVAAARSNAGHAPEKSALSWNAATLADHKAWEYSDSDEDGNLNDPTWRDVLNTQRAKRKQQSSFVERSDRNRAASMIQATWRLYHHRIEKLARLTVEEAMRRRPTTPAEYHEIHQRLWQQQRSFRRSKSSASSNTLRQANIGRSLSPALIEEDEESDSAAVSQSLLDNISVDSSKPPPSEVVAAAAHHGVKFSEEDLSVAAAAAASAAAVAKTAKQASDSSSPDTTARKPRKPAPPVVEVARKPKVKVQPWAGMVGREAAIMSTTKWKAAAKAAAAADAFSGAVHREGSKDSPRGPGSRSPDILKSPGRLEEHGAAPWEPVNSTQAAADQVGSSSAVSSRARSESASPEPATGTQVAASKMMKVSWEDVPEHMGTSGAESPEQAAAGRKAGEYSRVEQLQGSQMSTTAPSTAAAAAASGKSSGSGSESSEHIEVSLSGAAAPAAAPQVLQAQQEPRQERKQQHPRPPPASQQLLDGSHVLSLLETRPWQRQHEKEPDRQHTETLQEELQGQQQRQQVGSISGFLHVGTSSGAAEHVNTGSRASSLAGALVDFGVGMVSSMISFIRTGSAAGAKGSNSSSSEGKSASAGTKDGSEDAKGSNASAGNHTSNTQEQLATAPDHSSTLFAAINHELSIEAQSPKDPSWWGSAPAPVVAATVQSPTHAAHVHTPVLHRSGSPSSGSSSPASSSPTERLLPSPPQPSGKAASGNTIASGIPAQTGIHKANAVSPARVGSLIVSTAAADEEVGHIQTAPRSPRAARAVLRCPPATEGPAAAGPDINTDDLSVVDVTLMQQTKQGEENSSQLLSSLGRRFATARRMSQTVDEQHAKAHVLDGINGSNHSAALPAGPLVAHAGSPGAAAPSPNKRQNEERLLIKSVAGASMIGISSAGGSTAVKSSGSSKLSPSSSGSLFALPASLSSAGHWSSDRRLTPNIQTQQLLQQQQKVGLRVGSFSANAALQAAGHVTSSSTGADPRPLGVGAANHLGVQHSSALIGSSRSTDTAYRRAKSSDLPHSTVTQPDYGSYPPRQQGQMQGGRISAAGHPAGQLPTSSFSLLGSQPGGVQGHPHAVHKPASVLAGVPGHIDMSTAASGPKLTESHGGSPQHNQVGAAGTLAPVQGDSHPGSPFLVSFAAKAAPGNRVRRNSYDPASHAAAKPEAGSKGVTQTTSKSQIGLSTGNGANAQPKTSPVGALPALSGRRLSAPQSDFGA